MVKIGQSRGEDTSNLATKKLPAFQSNIKLGKANIRLFHTSILRFGKKNKCIFLRCGHCCLLKPIDCPLRPAADEIQVFFLVRKKPEMH